MITSDTKVTIMNKYGGIVGYAVEDLGVKRTFYPGEKKEITFEELEKLSFTPGGMTILKDFLEIKNDEAIVALFNKKPEIEYYYTKEDIKNLMLNGTLDQFLDCLDFAPMSVKETIKETKYDGGEDVKELEAKAQRRAAPLKKENVATAPTGRRYVPETK